MKHEPKKIKDSAEYYKQHTAESRTIRGVQTLKKQHIFHLPLFIAFNSLSLPFLNIVSMILVSFKFVIKSKKTT